MSAPLHALPLEERLRLVEELWDSIAVEQEALPLTRDLDLVSKELFSLRTNGGSEFCGAVIQRATGAVSSSGCAAPGPAAALSFPSEGGRLPGSLGRDAK